MSESLFKNVAGFKPVNLSRQRFLHRRIFVNFEKCLRTPLFIEHPRWVLPKFLVVIGRFQLSRQKKSWDVSACYICSAYQNENCPKGYDFIALSSVHVNSWMEIWLKPYLLIALLSLVIIYNYYHYQSLTVRAAYFQLKIMTTDYLVTHDILSDKNCL